MAVNQPSNRGRRSSCQRMCLPVSSLNAGRNKIRKIKAIRNAAILMNADLPIN
ncbi:hypothetical protein LZG72_24950 [Dyadobacter sp. CY323]|nr:hypothetical protein [Dyadobacter sp. CY323]MCE6992381.1 hypothetical protein [Dyadobacter sp. CY323]